MITFATQVIMEYCKVGSLAGLLATGIEFTEKHIGAILTSVLHGLCYLHTTGIVCIFL